MRVSPLHQQEACRPWELKLSQELSGSRGADKESCDKNAYCTTKASIREQRWHSIVLSLLIHHTPRLPGDVILSASAKSSKRSMPRTRSSLVQTDGTTCDPGRLDRRHHKESKRSNGFKFALPMLDTLSTESLDSCIETDRCVFRVTGRFQSIFKKLTARNSRRSNKQLGKSS